MNQMPDTISLKCLGFVEDGEWVAIALEMDLRGYGDSFESALDDLRESVHMQLSFARFKGDPSLILKPAADQYFEMYERNRKASPFSQVHAIRFQTETLPSALNRGGSVGLNGIYWAAEDSARNGINRSVI